MWIRSCSACSASASGPRSRRSSVRLSAAVAAAYGCVPHGQWALLDADTLALIDRLAFVVEPCVLDGALFAPSRACASRIKHDRRRCSFRAALLLLSPHCDCSSHPLLRGARLVQSHSLVHLVLLAPACLQVAVVSRTVPRDHVEIVATVPADCYVGTDSRSRHRSPASASHLASTPRSSDPSAPAFGSRRGLLPLAQGIELVVCSHCFCVA